MPERSTDSTEFGLSRRGWSHCWLHSPALKFHKGVAFPPATAYEGHAGRSQDTAVDNNCVGVQEAGCSKRKWHFIAFLLRSFSRNYHWGHLNVCSVTWFCLVLNQVRKDKCWGQRDGSLEKWPGEFCISFSVPSAGWLRENTEKSGDCIDPLWSHRSV